MKRKLVLFVLMFAVLSMAAYAASPTLQAVVSDVIIELNGQKLTLTDANGNEVKPLIVNGTTYLPVRAIGENLGLEVGWDGETRTVKLGTSTAQTPQAAQTPVKKDIYQKGDTWVTDEWKVTVNSVEVTEERNQFSDDKPAQVVFVNYTFENVNYDDDLFMSIDNVVDEAGNTCSTYPVSRAFIQSTPLGAKCTGDQAFGIVTESSKIKIYFSKYDSNSNKQRAIFELPVE